MAASLVAVPTLADLVDDPSKVAALPREAVPQIRGELARLDTMLLGRLLAPDGVDVAQSGDRLLDASEAAKRLGTSEDWIYRHAANLPFTVRIGKKHLRFSEAGIERYIRQRSGR